MGFASYMRSVVWEYLLACLVGVSLVYTLMDGFYIDPSLQYGPVAGIIAAAVLACLFLIGFNNRTTRIGGVAFGVAALGAVVVAAAASDVPILEDAPGNYAIFTLVVVLTPLFTYLLSRTRWGTALLFVAGAFICSWIQFFYERYELVWMFLFLAGALALIVYKNYQVSARSATSVRTLSFAAGFGVSLATVVVAVGLGSAVWFGVIAPLNPGAVQIKLVTETRALEAKLVQGSADDYQTPRWDLTSDTTTGDSRTTDDLVESPDGAPEPARPRDDTQVEQERSGSLLGVDIDSIVEAFDLENDNSLGRIMIGALVALLLAIIAYFVGRRLYRNHRLKKMESLEAAMRVSSVYKFLLSRLARLGFTVPDGLTLTEFAESARGAMSRIDETAGASFASLTETYVSVTYGKLDPTEEQLAELSRYYRGFWKAARRQLGSFKYFFKSFRL